MTIKLALTLLALCLPSGAFAQQGAAGKNPPPPPTPNYAAVQAAVPGIGIQNFAETWNRPDVNLAMGITHTDGSLSYYVQEVNGAFAVFNKSTDTLKYGPVAINAVFASLGANGNGCDTTYEGGDPIVNYDRKYDRWVFSGVPRNTSPVSWCLAISQTADPSGPYYAYSIPMGLGTSVIPDYQKMAIWPSGYFVGFDTYYQSTTFTGAHVCAMDRAAAVQGIAPAVECIPVSASFGA